jgi:S1-C subfamily serine protease
MSLLRRFHCLFILICLLSRLTSAFAQVVEVPASVREAQQQRIEVIERISPAVVAIFAPGALGGGSGVLISQDGLTVTNFHVIEGMQGFMKCGLNDGRVYDAVIVGIDPTGDLALVKLLGRDDFPCAVIGDSDTVQVGDWTYAIGNPFLLADDLQPTVTYGMVSGTHRYQYPAGTFIEYTDCIQVDTSINPGNSGGPLFNAQGELIGINGRISVAKRGRVNVGAGYAISMNQVLNFQDHLKSGRVVDHATLGATVTSASDGSVLVNEILERSSAYQQGLRSGDELVAFAGRPVRSVNQFKNILGIYPKGWELPLSYRREGQRYDILVRLMALHRDAELATNGPEEEQPHPPIPIPEELLEKLQPKSTIPEEY